MLNKILALTLILVFSLFWSNAYGQEKSENMKQAIDYFNKKQFDKALKFFKKEYKKNKSVEVKLWMADTYVEMNDVISAKSLFLEIINNQATGQELVMSLVNLGSCYRDLEKIDSAYYFYNLAIAQFPEYDIGYFNKGQLLYSQSKFEDARVNFDKAIELNGSDWWYYQKRLEVCFASQDYNCALKDLIKVKELKPDSKIESNLAYCYTMLKKFSQADSVFKLIYNDTDPIFLNNYGMNKYQMGQKAEGVEIIMKALSLQPSNSYIYRNLAVISIDENNTTKACEYLNKSLSLGFEKNYGNEVTELKLKYCN